MFLIRIFNLHLNTKQFICNDSFSILEHRSVGLSIFGFFVLLLPTFLQLNGLRGLLAILMIAQMAF